MPATDNTSIDFFKAISEASTEQKSAMIAEIEQYKEQQLLEARETAEKKYEEYILSASAKMADEDGVESEHLSLNLKKKVIAVRTEITDSVFSDVKKKAEAFVQTDEYRKMLIASAKKMVSLCGGAAIVIQLNSRDMKYAEDIKAVSDTVTVEENNRIVLGGIYGVCSQRAVRFNDLLESRLSAQKAEFYENSGLSLNH